MWLLCIVFGVLNWLLPPGKTFLRTGSACTRAVRAVVWVAHSSCWINHLKNMKKSTQPFIIVIENFILSDDHLEYKYIEVTLSLWNELNRVIFSWLSGHIAWETHSLRAQKNPRIYRDFSFVGEGSVVFSFCSIWKITWCRSHKFQEQASPALVQPFLRQKKQCPTDFQMNNSNEEMHF